MSFDWKKVVGSVAPVLGTALGGPFGGMATKLITDALGIKTSDPDQTAAAIDKVVATDPDAVVKIRKAELKLKEKMRELNIKESELVYKDIESARKRQIALKDKTPPVLAGLITLGFFGLLYILSFHAVPLETMDIIKIMTGVLGTAFISVITYYFGSSHGSAKKK